jgi:acid stress-induced BolA-like protein IbaG/YrbA
VISELLVLDDIATTIEHCSRHRMNDAWLISTLQGSDEIHALSLKGTSA